MINSVLRFRLESIGVRKRENLIAKGRKCEENKMNIKVIYVHLMTSADDDNTCPLNKLISI